MRLACTGMPMGWGGLARIAVADAEPAVRRKAATALGRIRRSCGRPRVAGGAPRRWRSVPGARPDLRLDRDCRPRRRRREGLHSDHPQVQRGALLALDQMEGGNLRRERWFRC